MGSGSAACGWSNARGSAHSAPGQHRHGYVSYGTSPSGIGPDIDAAFHLLGNQLNLIRGAGRFGEYSAVRLGQVGAWTGLVITFYVIKRDSAMGLLIGFVVITAAATGIAGLILFRLLGRPHFPRRGTSSLLRYGVLVWIAGIGFQINFRIDQLLLGGAVSTAAIGSTRLR